MRDSADGNISLESTQCCGLGELDGIISYADPEKLLIDLLSREDYREKYDKERDRYRSYSIGELDDVTTEYAHILFTEAVAPRAKNTRYGVRLANYIEKHGLGHVESTPQRKNPNSGNNVAAFLWTPNHKGIGVWFKWLVKNGTIKQKVGDL